METKRTQCMSELLAMFRRGAIDEKQYLMHKKMLLSEERTERQRIRDKAQSDIEYLSTELEEVEAELAKVMK